MANTEIMLVNDEGVYVASIASVPVTEGDTVSFSTSDGSAVVFYFSPDATAAVSPTPTSPFPLATGGTAVFAFKSSSSGAYSVFIGGVSSAAPESFPHDKSPNLVLAMIVPDGSVPGFNGPADTLKSGHKPSSS